MLIIYVIGSPLVMFLLVFKNRKKLGHPEVIQYILLLYQGLNHSKFYWEFVNTLRKFILLWIHVFITDRFKIVKALLGAVTMFVWSILQARLRPYKIEVVSDLGNNLISTFPILNLYRTQRNGFKYFNYIRWIDICSRRQSAFLP